MMLERLEPTRETMVFHSASGPLTVRRSERGYAMNFPARHCAPAEAPPGLAAALGASVEETLWDGFKFVVRLAAAGDVFGLAPDLAAIAEMACAGVIVTAPGDGDHDCVSRYFAPAKDIPEDPVIARGGELRCCLNGDRVELESARVLYLEGMAEW